MVLGKLPVPGRPTIWITVGQGPTALAVGAGGGCLDIFTLICPFTPLSPSFWIKWLTFHFHTTSQFRISNYEFRILKFALRISEFGIVKYMSQGIG